jgi:hypothetical protein
VVLHIQASRRIVVSHDLVHTLAVLGVRIGLKAGADALVGCAERLPAVLAHIVAAGRDAEVHTIAIANDRVHAQTAIARCPLARVFVVADARHRLPRVAAIMAPEE